MTIENTIAAGIDSRQLIRIEYTDNQGQDCTCVLEGYTLGYDHSRRPILKGFQWAEYPGYWYSTGRRIIPVDRLTRVELLEHKFAHPRDEAGAKDSSQFSHITCDHYLPGCRF